MKFNELTVQQWTEQKQYLDTCILPVTGLSGLESPVTVTKQVIHLRDWLNEIEIPFCGRVVTYPAYHFIWEEEIQRHIEFLNHICHHFHQKYKFIIVVSPQLRLTPNTLYEADLLFTPAQLQDDHILQFRVKIRRQVEQMWMATDINR